MTDRHQMVFQELGWLGVRWALLHDPPGPSNASADYDIVTSRPLAEFFEDWAARLRAHNVLPVLRVEYDIGGAETVWFWLQGENWVQADVLCDPAAMGRLGLPTDRMLDEVLDGIHGFQQVTPECQTIYQIAKRVIKQQWSRLSQLPTARLDRRQLGSLLTDVFEDGAALIESLLERGAPAAEWRAKRRIITRALRRRRWSRHGSPIGLGIQRLERLVGRLVKPVGAWIHFAGEDAERVAVEAVEMLKRHHPRVHIRRCDRRTSTGIWLLRIWPRLIRPAFYITWSKASNVDRLRPHPASAVKTELTTTWTKVEPRVMADLADRVVDQ